jgi:heme oxygenase (biliverdin-IX-beta and delta-forming)
MEVLFRGIIDERPQTGKSARAFKELSMMMPLLDLHAREFVPGADAVRSFTAKLHCEVERTLALPGSIQTMADYRRWLIRFFGIYQPLEHLLSGFQGWAATGIRINQLGHTEALLKDLKQMACNPDDIELASRGALPMVETFGQAFGALYVLEGSKLGGRYILKDLSNRLGSGIDGMDAFFTGYGPDTAVRWASFKALLDKFSTLRPVEFPEVIAGARMTYAAIDAWMSPLADSCA